MSGDEDGCIACHKPLPNDGKIMTCACCNNAYHLGKACSGIAQNTFNTMGLAKREAWVCKTCRSSKVRTGPGSQSEPVQTVGNVTADVSLAADLKEIKDSLLCLPVLAKKVDALLGLKDEVSNLRTAVDQLEKAVKFMSDQYDTVSAQLKECKSQNVKLQSDVAVLTTTVQTQAEQLQLLRNTQNDSEQYSRNANLEIHGLPIEENEDLKETLERLAAKLDIADFSLTEVVSVHRLQAKRDSIPTVLVRFATVSSKEKWSDARGKLRNLFQSDKLPKLFFNDNLTRQNRDLFWQARTVAKDKGYKFAWVKTGKIFVKKDESATLIRIGTLKDVDKIV